MIDRVVVNLGMFIDIKIHIMKLINFTLNKVTIN